MVCRFSGFLHETDRSAAIGFISPRVVDNVVIDADKLGCRHSFAVFAIYSIEYDLHHAKDHS